MKAFINNIPLQLSDNTVQVKNKKGDDSDTVITVTTDSYTMIAKKISSSGNTNTYRSYISTQNNDFFDLIAGDKYEEYFQMLIKAINNRTIERDYFRLYCDMLDGSISEEEFDKIIEENENDYIVDESESPSADKLRFALYVSKHIKSVDSIDDLSALFSFNPETLNEIAK